MQDNMTVKRFKPVASAAISLSENGDYVRYEDYAALVAEMAALKKRICDEVKAEPHQEPVMKAVCTMCGENCTHPHSHPMKAVPVEPSLTHEAKACTAAPQREVK